MMKTDRLLAALGGALIIGSATAGATDHSGVLELPATIRDVKRGDFAGGHTDFNTSNARNSVGHVTGLVLPDLGDDGKPVYNPTRSTNVHGNDPIASQASFDQWYRDVPGVNIALPITLRFGPKPDTHGVFTTDGFNEHMMLGDKFLPINGLGFGNQGHEVDGVGTNYLFTTEFHNEFNYVPGQHFAFSGDDDVWAYINGKLVVDLGGSHNKIDSELYLLDGKAFVVRDHFALSGEVHPVTPAMEADLAAKWQALGLEGDCPIDADDHRYIDLDLNHGGADVRVVFGDGSAEVRTPGPITQVVLLFTDGATQAHNVSGSGGTYTGTGSFAGRDLEGLWVVTGEHGVAPVYYGARGSGGAVCQMNFFHAERHYIGSNFKIETNMVFKEVGKTMISPLYD